MHDAIPAKFAAQGDYFQNESPMKVSGAGMQQPNTEARGQNNQASKLAQIPTVRKLNSTQSRRTKRKSDLQAPASQNLLSKLTGENADEGSSFAIADLTASHMQTQHMPDGKISLTLKVNERQQEQAGQIRMQNGAK